MNTPPPTLGLPRFPLASTSTEDSIMSSIRGIVTVNLQQGSSDQGDDWTWGDRWTWRGGENATAAECCTAGQYSQLHQWREMCEIGGGLLGRAVPPHVDWGSGQGGKILCCPGHTCHPPHPGGRFSTFIHCSKSTRKFP